MKEPLWGEAVHGAAPTHKSHMGMCHVAQGQARGTRVHVYTVALDTPLECLEHGTRRTCCCAFPRSRHLAGRPSNGPVCRVASALRRRQRGARRCRENHRKRGTYRLFAFRLVLVQLIRVPTRLLLRCAETELRASAIPTRDPSTCARARGRASGQGRLPMITMT